LHFYVKNSDFYGPQPEFSNHSLTVVGQVVDVKPIRFDTQKFNMRPKTYKYPYAAVHEK